jgi:hypothetical protein
MQKEFASKQIIYTMVYWFLEGTLFNWAASTRTGFNKDKAVLLQQSCALPEDIKHDEPPA